MPVTGNPLIHEGAKLVHAGQVEQGDKEEAPGMSNQYPNCEKTAKAAPIRKHYRHGLTTLMIIDSTGRRLFIMLPNSLGMASFDPMKQSLHELTEVAILIIVHRDFVQSPASSHSSSSAILPEKTS